MALPIDGRSLTVDGRSILTTSEVIIDSFEHNDLAGNYNLATSEWTIESNIPVDGTYHLRSTIGGGGSITSAPGDGLGNYFPKGNTVKYHTRVDTTNGGNERADFLFSTDGTISDYYRVQVDWKFTQFELHERTDFSATELDAVDVTPPSDEWLTVEITWDDGTLGGNDGDISAELFDSTDTSLATLFANDTSKNFEGIGFAQAGDAADHIHYDYVRR